MALLKGKKPAPKVAVKKPAPPPAVRKPAPPPAEASGGYEAEAGAGFESADRSAYSIPRINILQKMSPQVDKDHDDYVEGAEPGMFYNPVTKELFTELFVVPCKYRQTWVEWIHRDAGGGFVAEHETPNPEWTKHEKGYQETGEENHIVNDTRNFFVLLGGTQEELESSPQQLVLSLTATNIRVAMDWMTVMGNKKGQSDDGKRVFTLPMYASMFQLTTKRRENEHGVWWVYEVTDVGELNAEDSILFKAGREFKKLVDGGLVTAKPPAEADTGETTSAGNM